MAYKAPKPTKAQIAEGKARASAAGITMDQSAKGLRNAGKAIIKGAQTAALATGAGKAGALVGKVAGKAVTRAIAKEASPKVLKAANAARGSGKMVNPKAATGKIERTAPKRDVIVKTDDKTIATNGFISRNGHKVVKVNTKNPMVRTVEKEVTKAKAASQTKSTNKLRYGGAKAEASRSRDAVNSTNVLPKAGSNVGKVTGALAGAAAANTKKKK